MEVLTANYGLINIIDFGLVILIWMTQLIVYPGFNYYDGPSLRKWHRKYTKAVTYIVFPLMSSQLVIHLYGLWINFRFIGLISLCLIGLAWFYTFLVAIPLHNRINTDDGARNSIKRLLVVNWYRTFSWSVVFLLGLIA